LLLNIIHLLVLLRFIIIASRKVEKIFLFIFFKLFYFIKERSFIIKTYGRAINDAKRETKDRDTSGDLPLVKSRKLVLDDAYDHIAEGNGSAYTQYEQHQEEQHGEELRDYREFCQGFRVRNEGQACPCTYDATDIIAADLMGEIAQNSKDSRARH